MIDLHSHILPGIDDGAKDLDASEAMAFQSLEAGVTHMVCTPHIHLGYFDNNKKTIETAFNRLVERLKSKGCALKLGYSAEVRICPELMQWVKTGSVPFLGKWQQQQVLLLELPHSHIPVGTENLIRWLHKNSVQTVIAHPERNREIIADHKRISLLQKEGCLFQVTAGSFIGRFSESVKNTALALLEQNLVTYIASDTHSVERRPNDMGLCKEVLTPLIGKNKANVLLYTTPQKITQFMQWY